eukprot:TRINITY_DN12490_c0_g1_i1.p1 TRINITY_DN12490_c0_g1~~TRINITY_DN12490_c0_g1_i1.p1  ORF type:complete len:466 (-),score=86.75 TRINITY_DN12490_c0_g1_i1:172-1569(-)
MDCKTPMNAPILLASDHAIVEIVTWLDMSSVARLQCTCKRFSNKNDSVICKFIDKTLEVYCGIPQILIQNDPICRRSAMLRCDNRRHVLQTNDTCCSLIKPPTYEINHSQIRANIVNAGKDLTIQIPAKPEFVALGDDQLNAMCPAILRPSNFLHHVEGFLPRQDGYVAHMYNSEVLGSYLITASEDDNIYSTHINSHLVSSIDDLREVKAESVHKKSIFQGYMKCVSFHKTWGCVGTNDSVFVFILNDAIVDVKSEEKITAHSSFRLPEDFEIRDAYLNVQLNRLVCVSALGSMLILKNLDALEMSSLTEYGEKLWPSVPTYKRSVDLCVKDGFVVLMSNAGKILVLKYSEGTYVPWREYNEASFLRYSETQWTFYNPNQPRIDVQCGLLVTPDGSGFSLNVWDLTSDSDKPARVLSDMKQSYRIHEEDEFPYLTGSLQWSYDGRELLYTVRGGFIFKFTFFEE